MNVNANATVDEGEEAGHDGEEHEGDEEGVDVNTDEDKEKGPEGEKSKVNNEAEGEDVNKDIAT